MEGVKEWLGHSSVLVTSEPMRSLRLSTFIEPYKSRHRRSGLQCYSIVNAQFLGGTHEL